jgi:hypothetical protein
MGQAGADHESTPFVVVRSAGRVSHPHLNTWLARGVLAPDPQGRLTLAPNLPHTFQGVAEPTDEVETRPDGLTAQVYRLVRARLQTPPRQSRRPGSRVGDDYRG